MLSFLEIFSGQLPSAVFTLEVKCESFSSEIAGNESIKADT